MMVEGASLYFLLCADGSYYAGLTRKEVETRVSEHNLGINGDDTSRRRPVTLIWSRHYDQLTDAIAAERQIKGWSRAKKEALIRGDYDALPALAARRNKKAARLRANDPGPSPFETRAARAPQDEGSCVAVAAKSRP